jgi:protein TonB
MGLEIVMNSVKGVFGLLAALAALAAAGPAHANGWGDKVAQMIGAQYSYPRSAQIRGDQGTAKIRVSVSADGKITNVELVQPTGSEILDREAVRMPSKLGQLPPPPGAKPAALIVPITWKLS